MNTRDHQQTKEDLRELSILLDSRFKGLLGFRFGLDGLVGLIPLIGDLITSGFSFYIIINAARLGCSPSTLIRMAMNVLLDNVLNVIPFVGNIFDFFWKANTRNIILLNQHLNQPQRVAWTSRLILMSLFIFLLLIMGISAYFFWMGFLKFLELVSLATS
jgi:hypothetical protein